jgi:hypothetical protein
MEKLGSSGGNVESFCSKKSLSPDAGPKHAHTSAAPLKIAAIRCTCEDFSFKSLWLMQSESNQNDSPAYHFVLT